MPTKLVILGDTRPDQSGVPANGRQDPICRYKFLFHSFLQCQRQFETSEVFRSKMYFSDSRPSLSKLMWLADQRYQHWLSGRLLECVPGSVGLVPTSFRVLPAAGWPVQYPADFVTTKQGPILQTWMMCRAVDDACCIQAQIRGLYDLPSCSHQVLTFFRVV